MLPERRFPTKTIFFDNYAFSVLNFGVFLLSSASLIWASVLLFAQKTRLSFKHNAKICLGDKGWFLSSGILLFFSKNSYEKRFVIFAFVREEGHLRASLRTTQCWRKRPPFWLPRCDSEVYCRLFQAAQIANEDSSRHCHSFLRTRLEFSITI